MGKRDDRRIDMDVKVRKRSKRGKEAMPKHGIVDVLACAPVSRFHYELVVGNGIGEDAVEDAQEAFQRAWEMRRQKAFEAASTHPERLGKDCEIAEHRVVGPFSSTPDWRIELEADPPAAMTWCWVGYESITFCRPA